MKVLSSVRQAATIATALIITVAAVGKAQTQQPAGADTSTAPSNDRAHADARPSLTRRVIEFLAPEVGFVLGRSVGGTAGAIAGVTTGTTIGATMMFMDAHAAAAQTHTTQLCLVPGAPGMPSYTVPGVPPTPPIADVSGTPGTPDIVVPATPPTPDRWEFCR
jgi:hypothetical protein